LITHNDYFKIKKIDLSSSATVGHPASETQTLQPAAGKIYQVIEIYANLPDPAGSSAGTHYIHGKYQNITGSMIYISSGFGNDITIDQNGFTGSGTERPSGNSEQFLVPRGGMIICSNSQPFDFVYTNSTDVDQTGTRTLEILVKEYPERI